MTTAPAAVSDGIFSRRYAVSTVSYAAVMFLAAFAALAVIPILPVAARDVDGVRLYPLVAGSFVAAGLFGGVLGGYWSDRAGARRPLAAGMVLAVITLLVSASSTTVWQLAAGRFLDGLASGVLAVAINTAIGQSYPDKLRARVLALMSTCWIVPSLIGPPVAGLVVGWWSWRVVFYGLAIATAIPALAVVFLLRRSSSPGGADAASPRPNLWVAVAVSLGAAIAQYGVSAWDIQHLVFTAVGFALLAVFTPRLLPPGTWRAVKGLPATALLRGLASGTYFTLEAFVPLLLTTVRKVPGVLTGLAFTGAAVAWAASSWLHGRLAERVPRHRLVAVGAIAMGVAAVLAAIGTLPAVPAYAAAASLVAAALGMGMLTPALTLLSLDHSPPERQGHASSAMQTTQNLGQVMVLGFVSAVFNAIHAATTGAFVAAFGLLLVPIALAVALAPRAATAAARSGA
ncbi:MAG TPA: MFS transporter [Stackebrandtia sp.]|uniref:MFS transporter n=1 Tax=Stackebrandtia sp. TaxID=2023065 RepID=UPI002D6DEA96|nr:MFS transporter [Stackebrandtia sp.]HZE39001.1 MFS transporter [Stackebrandtia sp.]